MAGLPGHGLAHKETSGGTEVDSAKAGMLGSATEAEDIVQEAFLRFRVRDREHRRLELLVDVVHESPDAGGSPSKRTSMPPCDT